MFRFSVTTDALAVVFVTVTDDDPCRFTGSARVLLTAEVAATEYERPAVSVRPLPETVNPEPVNERLRKGVPGARSLLESGLEEVGPKTRSSPATGTFFSAQFCLSPQRLEKLPTQVRVASRSLSSMRSNDGFNRTRGFVRRAVRARSVAGAGFDGDRRR